jgi:hypothetical protein
MEASAFRYDGENITRTHVAGFDFNTGSFSHSVFTKETKKRKIIATARVSLDGVMQGPDGAQEDTSDEFDLGGWITEKQWAPQ